MIENLKQYSPDGEEIANWVLEVDDDKKVKHYQVYDKETGNLNRFGTYAQPIDYAYFYSAPEDKVKEIKDKHGEPTSIRFSHCPSSRAKWGWLVTISDKQFIISPSGWNECTIKAGGGIEDNIEGELAGMGM